MSSPAFILVGLLAVGVAADAKQPGTGPQAPAAKPAAPATSSDAPASAAAPAAKAPPAEIYTYQSDGRRDPFLSLLGTGTDAREETKRVDGPGGMAVAEVSVRGVVQSRGALIAMIQGPDSKTYVVHQGDRFFDGTIRSITPQGLIVTQEVKDPLSLVKQREIRKLLRSLEDAKEKP
jgi:Tfp pilus assembly protein PilP